MSGAFAFCPEIRILGLHTNAISRIAVRNSLFYPKSFATRFNPPFAIDSKLTEQFTIHTRLFCETRWNEGNKFDRTTEPIGT